VRAPLLLLTALILLPLLAAQPDSAVLVVVPTKTALNVSAGEVVPLAFVVQNLGEETASNVTVTLTASGCVQLLSWNGTWEKNLVAELNDITPGSAKRLVVPIRCQSGKGSVVATAYGDNTDPAFASVTVSAESGGPQFLALIPLATAVLVALAYVMARTRRGKEERKSIRRVPSGGKLRKLGGR